MEVEFSASADFLDALKEIRILVGMARDNVNEEIKRSLFLKSGLLFLATKFECFVEDIIKEYVYNLENLKFTSDELPEELVLSIIDCHFSEALLAKIKQKKSTCKEDLIKIIPFLNPVAPIDTIPVEIKFAYGRHGTNIIESLFNKIGVRDIFLRCAVKVAKESMLSDLDQTEVINIKSEIDSLTGMRNAIIHENKSPSISEERIESYVESLSSFAQNIANLLTVEIALLKKKSTIV